MGGREGRYAPKYPIDKGDAPVVTGSLEANLPSNLLRIILFLFLWAPYFGYKVTDLLLGEPREVKEVVLCELGHAFLQGTRPARFCMVGFWLMRQFMLKAVFDTVHVGIEEVVVVVVGTAAAAVAVHGIGIVHH